MSVRFVDPRMVEKHSRLRHSDVAKEEETISMTLEPSLEPSSEPSLEPYSEPSSEPSTLKKTETIEDKKLVQVAIAPEVGRTGEYQGRIV